MRRPKNKPYYVSLVVSREMYEKVQRLADADYCAVSAVIRRLIASAPEPNQAKSA